MADKGLVFYTLERHEVLPPKPGEFRLSTAAVRECETCGNIISGMGGGEPSICEPCAQVIMTGRARGTIQWGDE